MQVLFDDEIFVHYGFMFINPSDEDSPDLDDSRAGQTNGLLGGAVPGQLSLITATHTGDVRLRIEWHEHEPAIDPAWEDVVELSLELTDTDLTLSAFDDFRELTAPVTGSHRVRLNATGMDAAREADSPGEGESAADRYLLQLWPAPPAPDRIVRQTSQCAAYWHGVAQDTPPVTPEQIAERLEERNRPAPVVPWRPPATARDGRDIVNAFPGSAKVEARVWLPRRACEIAGISDVPWVRAAVDALWGQGPPPGPYRNSAEALAGLDLPATVDRDRARVALDCVFTAATADPLGDLGAMVTVAQAAAGPDGPDLVLELCRHFGFAE